MHKTHDQLKTIASDLYDMVEDLENKMNKSKAIQLKVDAIVIQLLKAAAEASMKTLESFELNVKIETLENGGEDD